MINTLTKSNPEQLISRSWQRSQAYGLEQYFQTDPYLVSKGLLIDYQQEQAALLKHLNHLLPLFQQLQGNKPCSLLFANTEGVILYSSGADCFAGKARKIALAPGASWHERNMGTNAIGTALMEEQEVSVLGVQHFFCNNQQIGCSASPVFSPTGQLLGVVDISSEAHEHSQDMLFSARLLAQSLENALLAEQAGTYWLLNLVNHSSYTQLPWSGLIALGEDGEIIGANRIAKNWLIHLDLPHLLSTLRQGELTPVGEGMVLLSRKTQEQSSSVIKTKPFNKPKLNTAQKKALTLLNAGIPLLIQGETGVGKDHLVNLLQQQSDYPDQPLIAVNCGALPNDLIEAELFGYKPGAFTGSNKDGRLGYIRAADQGILFLDEIGDLPLTAQTRLLRVLQEKSVTPLGCHTPIPVNFKVIAASHKNLVEMVEEGIFRQDLFFRLSGYQIKLPALRDYTKPDFEQLVYKFLCQLQPNKQPAQLSKTLLDHLYSYVWPGNIRQLKQVLEVAFVLADGQLIECKHLPELPSTGTLTKADNADLATHKQKQITQVLAGCGGNVSAAARKLGISRTTIYAALKS